MLIKSATNNKTIDFKTKHITLAHEYEANKTYKFGAALMNVIKHEATYYQSNKQNKLFTIDEIMTLLIFLKFSSFRILLHQHIIELKSDFIYLYRRLCFMEYSLDLPKEERMGYTALNCQISSRAPIIFSQNADALFFGAYTGIIFDVRVRGKFVPLSVFGAAFDDIFLVIVPEEIEIVSQSKPAA